MAIYDLVRVVLFADISSSDMEGGSNHYPPPSNIPEDTKTAFCTGWYITVEKRKNKKI